jgi:hypothetical protein
MTLLPTGKVLVAGGTDFNGLDTRTSELYDPNTGQWTTTGAMRDARAYHTATLLPTGEVLVTGGVLVEFSEVFASAELYDPATGKWRATGQMALARFLHTATLLASGHVLVVGNFATLTSSTELYDPVAGTWTAGTPMLTERQYQTATLLSSGAVLVAGGTPLSDVAMDAQLYEPTAETWRRTGPLQAPYAGHTATRLPSGRVLVVGGFAAGTPDTELFDPETETWSDAGCNVEARGGGHTATLLSSGALLVTGPDSSAELYGIVVSPAQVSLAPGSSQTFTASKGSGLGYVWSFLENKSGGTLSAAGVYQAGSVGGVTDILQVVDSLANAATATVNVQQVGAAVSATSPQAKSMGCGVTDASAPPVLAGAVVLLVGCTALTRRRGGRHVQSRP